MTTADKIENTRQAYERIRAGLHKRSSAATDAMQALHRAGAGPDETEMVLRLHSCIDGELTGLVFDEMRDLLHLSARDGETHLDALRRLVAEEQS